MTALQESKYVRANTTDNAVDLLNRQEFIDKVFNIIETISQNKRNVCFAINGEWGSGKTWLLDKLEQKLRLQGQEGTTLNKYFVFHYNCWQYDYYNEPLIAVVAVLLEQIDEEMHLVTDDKKKIIKGTIKAIGLSALNCLDNKIAEVTGIDLKEMIDVVVKQSSDTAADIAENHDYDIYFDFNKILSRLSDALESLSKDQTIVLVVDELDRCMPEYAIKVLERLHHIFYKVPNIQVVLAVDKLQLEHTVRQIYGENTDVNRFLSKFIDFELGLSLGEIGNMLEVEYPLYHSCFEESITPFNVSDDFCNQLFTGIEIRLCKQIVEKSYLCHRLLSPDNVHYDTSIMCLEIFLSVLSEYGMSTQSAKNYYSQDNTFSTNNSFFEKPINQGLRLVSKRFANSSYYFLDISRKTYIQAEDVWGLMLGCYRYLIGFTDDQWIGDWCRDAQVGTLNVKEYTLTFWQFIKEIS